MPEWPERVVGVDLAARDERTAVCVLERDGDRVRVAELSQGWGDEDILASVGAADKAGIDSPLGWPVAFVDAVTEWNASGRWPAGLDPRSETLQLRRTDRVVRDATGRRPLSVSTDRLGVVAFRAARLLDRLAGEGSEVDRTGVTGGVAEVYPAAALATWGLPRVRYKTQESALANLARSFRMRCPWLDLEADRFEETRASHDEFDALVAAVLAAHVAMGSTEAPEGADVHLAEIEGWIHLPREAEILGPHRSA